MDQSVDTRDKYTILDRVANCIEQQTINKNIDFKVVAELVFAEIRKSEMLFSSYVRTINMTRDRKVACPSCHGIHKIDDFWKIGQTLKCDSTKELYAFIPEIVEIRSIEKSIT